MKNGYKIAYLNYIVSALWYIAAVIGFINDSDMAAMWLCLGSVWLCLASSSLVKAGKKQREEEEQTNDAISEEYGEEDIGEGADGDDDCDADDVCGSDRGEVG